MKPQIMEKVKKMSRPKGYIMFDICLTYKERLISGQNTHLWNWSFYSKLNLNS